MDPAQGRVADGSECMRGMAGKLTSWFPVDPDQGQAFLAPSWRTWGPWGGGQPPLLQKLTAAAALAGLCKYTRMHTHHCSCCTDISQSARTAVNDPAGQMLTSPAGDHHCVISRLSGAAFLMIVKQCKLITNTQQAAQIC